MGQTTSPLKEAIRRKEEAEKSKAASTPKRNATAAKTETPPTPRPAPPNIEAYYESGKGRYWVINGRNQWQSYGSDEMSRLLKIRGYSAKAFDGCNFSEVENYLYRISYHQSIDFAGELAGWNTGVYDIGGQQVLVTKSRRRIDPIRGEFPILKRFIKTLLTNQTSQFLGWLKGRLLALDDGSPFRPGQLCCLVGKGSCGKSFLQLIITEVLGGRIADPCPFLAGETGFTGDLGRCEHLMVEDKSLKDLSNAKRRHFGANIKAFVANQHQRVRAMQKEALLLPVCTTLTLSVNDNPKALAILPPLDDDLIDKIMIFKCAKGDLPARHDRNMTWPAQWELVLAEIPAFVHYLYRMKVPEKILDPERRFYVTAYQNPDIALAIGKMSCEEKLLYLIDSFDVAWKVVPVPGGEPVRQKEGTAAEIENWLRKADLARQLDRILSNSTPLGVLLSNLAREGNEAVTIVSNKGNKHRYRIWKEAL